MLILGLLLVFIFGFGFIMVLLLRIRMILVRFHIMCWFSVIVDYAIFGVMFTKICWLYDEKTLPPSAEKKCPSHSGFRRT